MELKYDDVFFHINRWHWGRSIDIVKDDGTAIVCVKFDEKYFPKTGSIYGLSVLSTERRKGYNKINLYLGLLEEQRLGEKKVLLECIADNQGSNKTIIALGGILEKSEIDDWDNELTNYYWIDVDKSIEEYRSNYIQFISKKIK